VNHVASANGRAPRLPVAVSHSSQSAGASTMAKAAIFSGDHWPDFSRRKGMTILGSPVYAHHR
jgi:hypothetical protein